MRKRFLAAVLAVLILAGPAFAFELIRQRNTITNITFPMVNLTGGFVTGAAGLDSEIDAWSDTAVPDGFADTQAEATEIGSTGMYYLSLNATETNSPYIVVQVKTSTANATTQAILIRTVTGNFSNVAVTDDGGNINVTNGKIDNVTLVDTATAVTTVNGLANNVVTANAINAAAITNAKFASGAIDAAAVAADAIGASELAADAATEVGVAVWANTTRTITDKAGFSLAAGSIANTTFAANAVNVTVAPLLSNLDVPVSSRGICNLTASDNIGINWGDVSNPTTTVGLTGTTISTTQAVASVSGAVGSVSGAVGSVSGAVGSVTGAVGSVTAPVSVNNMTAAGNYTALTTAVWTTASRTLTALDEDATTIDLDGSAVGSVAGAVTVGTNNDKTGYTASTVSDKTGYSLAADQSGVTVGNATVVGSVTTKTGYSLAPDQGGVTIGNVTTVADKTGYNVTVAAAEYIAGKAWDTTLADHLGAGSTGAALNAAGSAGDPWNTALPGAYGAGSAGYILGNNLNANVSSRSTLTAADVWANATRTITGGTVSTVSDKTGYALTQAFPGNFSAMKISEGGNVTAGSIIDKAGYSISGSKTTLDALNDINATQVWSAGTRTLTAGAYSGLSAADVDLIWDEAQSGHTTAGTFGKYLDGAISGISVSGGGLTAEQNATLSAIANSTDGDKEGGNYSGIENLIRQQR